LHALANANQKIKSKVRSKESFIDSKLTFYSRTSKRQGCGGGCRAFAGSPRLPEDRPSGLAWAPKVASAPRGPGSGILAGNLAQSLPQAAGMQKRRF